MAITQIKRKVCFKCGEIKPLSGYYRHKMMADGHLGKCKDCTMRDVRANRRSRLDYYRKYDLKRSRFPHRIENSRRVAERAKLEKPAALRARTAVGNAVRAGLLVRSTECEVCHTVPSRIFGHHDDYAKPLEVRWLCQPCHVAWHKENGPGKNAAAEESAA